MADFCCVLAGTASLGSTAADEKNALVFFALLKALLERRATVPRLVSIVEDGRRMDGGEKASSQKFRPRRNKSSHNPGFPRWRDPIKNLGTAVLAPSALATTASRLCWQGSCKRF